MSNHNLSGIKSDAIGPKARGAPTAPARLRAPRAAAVAGILFSVLFISSLWLLQLAMPIDPVETGAWLETSSRQVSIALNLIPFAGIAFMWFIGVLRDRLGPMEDQFVATVLLGSGYLLLGMLFVAAAAVGGLVLAYSGGPKPQLDAGAFAFARAFTFAIMHIYAFKMAGVFMIATSTLIIRTRFVARWIALFGYSLALFLLIGSGYFDWTLHVFPAWVLLVSGYILLDNLRASPSSPPGDPAR